MSQGKIICEFYKAKDFEGMGDVEPVILQKMVDRANIVLKQKVNGQDATDRAWQDFLAKYSAPVTTGTFGQQDLASQANSEVGTTAHGQTYKGKGNKPQDASLNS